jgi:hypothetical protein
MAKGQSIAGRKVNIQYDLYETPESATIKILNKLIEDEVLKETRDNLYECCSGAGAITRVLDTYYKFNYKASDIQTDDFIVGDKGIDVYTLPDKCCDIVFTNPPYDLMTKNNMLQEFLRISKNKVILLLNIYFLASEKRKELLKQSHLKYVYIHSDRLTMFPFGSKKPEASGTKMFSWFIFEHGYEGEPVIRWL